jgi:hypothetical protein
MVKILPVNPVDKAADCPKVVFCQVLMRNESPDSIEGVWARFIKPVPLDTQIYSLIKSAPEFGFEITQKANNKANVEAMCVFNGEVIGETDTLSSLSVGKSLKERTCVVAFYDKNSGVFSVEKVASSLKTFDSEECLVKLAKEAIIAYGNQVNSFSVDLLGTNWKNEMVSDTNVATAQQQGDADKIFADIDVATESVDMFQQSDMLSEFIQDHGKKRAEYDPQDFSFGGRPFDFMYEKFLQNPWRSS